MKKTLLFVSFFLLAISTISFAQITSAASGIWSDGTTWVGGVAPGTTDDVIIASGHTVTVSTSTCRAQNLTVNSGGTITADGDNLASANLRYIRLYGNVTNNGTIGTGIDGLSINLYYATPTFSGSNIKYAKLRPNATLSAVVTIAGDVTLSYNGAALQFQNNPGQNITTVNVNAGASLTTIENADFTTASSVNTDVTDFAPTINIDGTVSVGGIITLRSLFGPPSIVVNSTGTLTVNENVRLTTTTYTNPGTISGDGSFTLGPNGKIEIAMADGLNPTTGQIRTTTRTFPASAGYTYVGTAAQVTGSDLPSVIGRLSINNSFGVTLSGNTTVDSVLSITSGNLITDTKTLTLSNGASISGEDSAKYAVGTLVTTQTVLADSASTLGGVGVSLAAGVDNLGDVTVTRVSGVNGQVTVGGKTGISRKWTITSTNPPTNGRDISFTWTKDDDNGKDLTTAVAYKSTDAGTTWFKVGSEQNIDTSRVITVNATSFSDWTVSDAANALPVELVSFNATVSGKDIILSWRTATELNNRGWEIERTNNAVKTWTKVGFVNGVGTTTSPNNYSFTDKNLTNGKYLYRLKQIDNDGTASYSKTAEVDFQGRVLTYALDNYPNPFNPETKIRFEIPVNSFVNVSVFNLLGEKVATLINENLEKGVYEKSFGSSNLTSGVYIYKLTAGTYTLTKKMMLIR